MAYIGFHTLQGHYQMSDAEGILGHPSHITLTEGWRP